jgi:hypothetical protein
MNTVCVFRLQLFYSLEFIRTSYDYVAPCFPPEWEFFSYWCHLVHRQYENQVCSSASSRHPTCSASASQWAAPGRVDARRGNDTARDRAAHRLEQRVQPLPPIVNVFFSFVAEFLLVTTGTWTGSSDSSQIVLC